ncbi:hypothetical protein D3C80_126940 [compost metagenome]
MAYATVQDMIDRFTLDEVKQLAPIRPAVEPGYDVVRVQQVLDDASAELDSYLAIRFPVPITERLPLLEKACCDLAREALDRTGRTPVLEAGKRARTWARDVAQGKATLGAGPAEDVGAVPAADGGGASVIAPDRVFTDESLQAYLR